MTRFVIVRHGNTFEPGDVVTRVGARTDLTLSPSGLAQAERLAAHFAGQRFDALLQGPLRRTRETAAAIAARLVPGIAPATEEGLREIDYGPDENQPEPAVVLRLGAETLAAWDSEGRMPPDWSPRPPALIAMWRSLFAAHAGRAGAVMIVTSNGIARFALDALDLAGRPADIKLRTGAYGVIESLDAACGRVTAWNLRP